MSNQVVMEVGARETTGKGMARRGRRAGRVPGVGYGGGVDPVPVEFDPRPVEAILDSDRGLNTLIQLTLAGRELKRMVMLREIQRHPVTERLLHADFFRVELDRTVDIEVPISLLGIPVGVKDEGGIVQHVTRSIEVRVLPTAIPDSFEIDISALHVGQHLEVGDLDLPEGVELLGAPTETIVTIAAKVAEEEVAEEAAAEEGEAVEEGAAEEGAAEEGAEKTEGE